MKVKGRNAENVTRRGLTFCFKENSSSVKLQFFDFKLS